MALKGDREVLMTNVYWKIESGKDAERGTILIASGTDGTAAKPSTSSLSLLGTERPIGLLLDDVADLDWTTRPMNLQKQIVPRASEISVLTKGRVKTNLIKHGQTVAAGQKAYLHESGLVGNTERRSGSGVYVGWFESAKDSDGYAHLFVDIQGI